MNIERVCRRDLTLAYEDEPIHEIAKRMRERHVGSVIVVSRGGARLGEERRRRSEGGTASGGATRGRFGPGGAAHRQPAVGHGRS
jgi:CBS domain-containing protein